MSKVNFDGLRQQMIGNYNSLVNKLNTHIDNGELEMDEYDLQGLFDRLHDLKMNVVVLAYLSGENQTFGEVATDDTNFLDLAIGNEEAPE